MSTEKTISKWIEIVPNGTSPSGTTKRWRVRNKRTGENIGEIKWYGANGFRGYCYFIGFDGSGWMLYDAPCMRMIADFISEQNVRHREVKSAHKSMRHQG